MTHILRHHSFVKPAPMRGFTLIEFMVTLVIAAILLTIAAPAFTSYIATQRLRNASYDLVSAMQIARSEAIKRNANIDVVRNGTSWSEGWKVKFAADVIRNQSGYENVAITDSPATGTVTYGNDGRPSTASTTFKLEPAKATSQVVARCVKIGLSGTATSTLGGC